MFKSVKIATVILVGVLLAYTGARLYVALTDGFSVANITYDKPFDVRWQTPLLLEGEIAVALSQSYTYLGKGHQSFVFESADGQYVVKFLKCHLIELKPWVAAAPLPSFLRKWRERRLNAKRRRLEGIFGGWKIASEVLRDETGVLAIHLNTTNSLQKRLSVKNKAGWKYEIDLDKTAFMVQRKVEMFTPSLKRLLDEDRREEAKALVIALLSTYKKAHLLGISDDDPQIMRNTGVSAGVPILIDVGRLKVSTKTAGADAYFNEVKAKTRLFKQWLEKTDPYLATFLDQQISQFSETYAETSS